MDARDGRRLVELSADPLPIVVRPELNEPQPIRRVGWRIEVEVNQQDKVFWRAWQPVGHSRRSRVGARTGLAVTLPELRFAPGGPPPDPTQIYRVAAVIYWWSDGRRPAGSLTVPLRRYVDSDRPVGHTQTDGCPAQTG